jgi:hypothetical protein
VFAPAEMLVFGLLSMAALVALAVLASGAIVIQA